MRTKPLTPDEVRETLEATRDQIAMADGPIRYQVDHADDRFRVGDSVVVARPGRFRTDRAVPRTLSVGDKLTVIGVGAETVTAQDNDGNRFKIRFGYLTLNPKGTR